MNKMNKKFLEFATNGNIDGLKSLIDKGVNINVQDKKGRTALILSSWYSNTTSNIETVNLLIESGAKLNIRDETGHTALMLSSVDSNKTSNIETVNLLIERGANLDIQDKYGRTALMNSCMDSTTTSSLETVKLLIKRGADIDIQDNDERTALILASWYSDTDSSLETVKLLIESGANLDIQDIKGKTFIDILKKKYDNSVISELVKSSPERAVLNKRFRVNISKTVTYFDPIMQSEETINIGDYIEEDKDNIVIVYNNNNYFMTTREIIQMQLDDATFYPCKEVDMMIPENIIMTQRLYDLKKIGFPYGVFANINSLDENKGFQTFALVPLNRSYPSFVSKSVLDGGSYVSALHCQEGQKSKISYLIPAIPSTKDNEKPITVGGRRRKGKKTRMRKMKQRKTRKQKTRMRKMRKTRK